MKKSMTLRTQRSAKGRLWPLVWGVELMRKRWQSCNCEGIEFFGLFLNPGFNKERSNINTPFELAIQHQINVR